MIIGDMKNILFTLFCIIGLANLNIQAQEKEQLQVLKKAAIGHKYIFGTWTPDNQGETHLTYLGKCQTTNGQTYKILTSVWLWGLSKRATNRILIFDHQNRYLGNYKINMADDLPFKMEKGKLRFKNTQECSYRSSLFIDLTRGIPEKIFIECTKGSGDEYLFDKG